MKKARIKRIAQYKANIIILKYIYIKNIMKRKNNLVKSQYNRLKADIYKKYDNREKQLYIRLV